MLAGQLMDPLVVVIGYYKKAPVCPGVGTALNAATSVTCHAGYELRSRI